MDAAEILERAADEMQRRGKCEGAYERNGRVCAMGALRVAIGVPFNAIGKYLPRHTENQIMDSLESFIAGHSVSEWSDNTPEAEVIAGLRAVAATLRAQSAATPVAEVA